MRSTFDNTEARDWAHPANPESTRHRAWLALIFVLIVLALGGGALIAAAYDALTDIDARGVTDPTPTHEEP